VTDEPIAEARRTRAGESALRLAVPAFGLAFALVLFAMSGDLRGSAGWYARILVILIGVIALYSLIVELVQLRRRANGVADPTPPGPDASEDDDVVEAPAATVPRGGTLRVVFLIASIFVMMALADILGFWVSTLIPVLTCLLILDVRLRNALIAAVLTVAAGFVVFQVLLQIRFTDGILGLI
jgi:hypothetical protein